MISYAKMETHSFCMCTFSPKFFKRMTILDPSFSVLCRGWVPKFATGLIYQIGHSLKSIWVTRLVFCQNNYLMRGSFWPKNSLITYIIFELYLIWYLTKSQILGLTLYVNLNLLWKCFCKFLFSTYHHLQITHSNACRVQKTKGLRIKPPL